MAEIFLEGTHPDNFHPPAVTVKDVIGKCAQSHMTRLTPWIMDQSCREPATATTFGHTAKTKYMTFQLLRRLQVTDIAVAGMFYGNQPTPESLFLELLKQNKEPMDGTIVMFPPFRDGRTAALSSMREYEIPNAFLDLSLGRFDSANDSLERWLPSRVDKNDIHARMQFVEQEVLDAVNELDAILRDLKCPEVPWRSDKDLRDQVPCRGEITINFVDIMEYLSVNEDPANDSMSLDQSAFDALVATIKAWQSNPVFNRRVVAILIEEGRGLASHTLCGHLVKQLRGLFPRDGYRIAIHCHAGSMNCHDVASIHCLNMGADGVWASMIPQAAVNGHNNWFSFLDTLMTNGNPHAWNMFWLHFAETAASTIFNLNFNTIHIPEDCPIQGGRPRPQVLSAFDVAKGGHGTHWKQRVTELYTAKMAIKYQSRWEEAQDGARSTESRKAVAHLARHAVDGDRFRIAALVSDDDIWLRRMFELKLVKNHKDEDLVPFMRRIAFALMNANIRVNFNSRETLALLMCLAKDRVQTLQAAEASCKTNH